MVLFGLGVGDIRVRLWWEKVMLDVGCRDEVEMGWWWRKGEGDAVIDDAGEDEGEAMVRVRQRGRSEGQVTSGVDGSRVRWGWGEGGSWVRRRGGKSDFWVGWVRGECEVVVMWSWVVGDVRASTQCSLSLLYPSSSSKPHSIRFCLIITSVTATNRNSMWIRDRVWVRFGVSVFRVTG